MKPSHWLAKYHYPITIWQYDPAWHIIAMKVDPLLLFNLYIHYNFSPNIFFTHYMFHYSINPLYHSPMIFLIHKLFTHCTFSPLIFFTHHISHPFYFSPTNIHYYYLTAISTVIFHLTYFSPTIAFTHNIFHLLYH